MIKRPAIYVMIMTFWWSVPAFIIQLQHYQLKEYLSSYLLYYLIFGVTLVFTAIISKEKKAHQWATLTIRQRYFWLCARYAINIGIIFIFMFVMLHFRLLDTFETDPEGSIAMAFFPTVLAYFLPGVIVCFIVDWSKWIRRHLTRR